MNKFKLSKDLHSQIAQGPTCFFAEHSIGSKDGLVPRFADSHACVRCISSLSEGRLSLDVHRIHRSHRRKFLEFWSFVEIGEPDECWPWRGEESGSWKRPLFSIKRHWACGNRYSPNRVATWYSWGDVGRLPIKSLCKNGYCCNPLHMRVRGVAHFFNNRKLDFIDLEFNSQKLMHDTQLFLETTQEKDPKGWKRLVYTNQAWMKYRMQEEGELVSDDLMLLRDPRYEAGPIDLEHCPDFQDLGPHN